MAPYPMMTSRDMPEEGGPGLFTDPPSPAAERGPGGVIVREVPCRSLLNRSSIGDYSFNCYTGCQNACAYCYARFMQRFHPHAEPWGCFVDVKTNAAEVLARQLRRLPPGSVFTCSACDGWQPVEAHVRLTRRCCRLLLEAGFRLSILTKSELVLREAKAAGLETCIMFGPLLPAISDTPEALRELFSLAASAKVDHVWTDILNRRPRVWPSVRELLLRRWPELLEHYRRILFEADFRERYERDTRERIRQAGADAGLVDRLAGQ